MLPLRYSPGDRTRAGEPPILSRGVTARLQFAPVAGPHPLRRHTYWRGVTGPQGRTELHQYTAPPVIDLFLWTESYTPRHGHLGSMGLLLITVLQTQTPPGYLGSIGLLAITGY